MSSLSSTLENVWKRKDVFCCLCFASLKEESAHVEDEILVTCRGSENLISVSEILCSILDYEILDYLFTFKHVCKVCVQTAVNSYNFIKTSQYNTELLTNTINGLVSSLENTGDEIEHCKTLFVSLNTADFTSKQFYDLKKRVTSIPVARHRYNLLNSIHIKPEKEEVLKDIKIEPFNVKSEAQRKSEVQISTKDIVYDERDSLIRCKVCLKVYASTLSLKNHYIRVHAAKQFKCSECKKAFSSEACLEDHKSDKHCTIICSECGKTFKNKQSFNAHEMSHMMSIICQDCGRIYKNKSTYKKHKELNICGQMTRASPANAKYTCDYCNKKYTQKVSLRVHIQYEHGNYKYHVCNICNKKFWAKSRLKAHMVKHTKEKNFNCTLCNGKFVTKEALLYHTRIHTGEKPYACNQCDARFLSASRRSEHAKRHHTNATLECDICGSKFNSQNYLQKHKKSHFNSMSTGNAESDDCINLAPQKVNEVDFIKLTQELKRFSNDDYKINEQHEVYLEFSNEVDEYNISGM